MDDRSGNIPLAQRIRLAAMAVCVLLAAAMVLASLISTATAPQPNAPATTPAGEVLPGAEHGDATDLMARYGCDHPDVWRQTRPGGIPGGAILTYPNQFAPRAVPLDQALTEARAGLAEDTLALCDKAPAR